MNRAASLTRYVVLPAESYVDVESRTSSHTVIGRGTDITGSVDAAWQGYDLLMHPMPAMRIEVPVAKLKSENAAQDEEMRKFIGSRAFPKIVVELRKIDPLAERDLYLVRGSIAVRGSTAEYDGRVKIVRDRNKLTVDGSEMIYIRKLGLDPPKILIFQVNAYVRITLHLVAQVLQ